MRLVVLVAAGTVGLLTPLAYSDDPPVQTITVTRTETVRKLQSYQGWSAYKWARRTWYWKRRSVALKRTLLDRPQVQEAINLACVVYGNCDTLWRRARCESGLFPGAVNASSGASGLLQFLPSTWRTTPFARFSPFSAYANVLAAGWMIGVAGRGNEWSCR